MFGIVAAFIAVFQCAVGPKVCLSVLIGPPMMYLLLVELDRLKALELRGFAGFIQSALLSARRCHYLPIRAKEVSIKSAHCCCFHFVVSERFDTGVLAQCETAYTSHIGTNVLQATIVKLIACCAQVLAWC